ncbi:MAG: O-antigen ligase family protein, partial [Candidatus Omnitrophica bacterium]|nr:O-antigen ligase family protein [Candidatus Omnitrophota bacterium]
IILTRPLLDIVLDSTRIGSGEGGIGLGAVLNLGVIILVVFLAFYLKRFPWENSVMSCWVIYLACMLAAVLYSPIKMESVRMWSNYLSYFALFLLPFFIVKDSRDFLFWIKVLGFSFVLPILLADVDMARGGRYFEDAGMRIAGTFTHPNILAFYLVLAFTFFFYLLNSGYLKSRPMVGLLIRAMMVDILALLVATKTRNAWISIYVGFIIYAVLKDRKMLALLIIVVPLFCCLPPVYQRMESVLKNKTVGRYQSANSFEWRRQIWESSIPKILQKPVQGYGLGTFKYMSGQFSENKHMGAHNTYLELAFETGLVGLTSFIVLFLSQLAVFFRNMRSSQDPAAARIWTLMVGYVITYMLICSADNLLYYLVFNWYVWFFIGLMVVAAQRRYPVYA